jgi:hypothetical protein
MDIYAPQLSYVDDEAVVSARFTAAGEEETLWCRFDRTLAPFAVLEKADAFLVPLLVRAMVDGEDIHLHHPVSEEVYYNLTENLFPLLNTAMPQMKRVKVIPSGFADLPPDGPAGAVALAFSCGIDSFYTYIGNTRPDVPPGHRPTYAVFTDVGAHGPLGDEAAKARYDFRLANVQKCAAELGLKLIVVRTNMSQVLPEPYVDNHTMRNAGVALILEKLFRTFYYSSGVPYARMTVPGAKDIGYYEPMVLSLLSTRRLQLVSFGPPLMRAQKTRVVSEFEPSYRYLNVCTITGYNCSTCPKCLRTAFTLDMLGKIDRYASVFDLEKYRAAREGYVFKLKANKKRDPYTWEKLDLMKEAGFKLGVGGQLRYLGYKTNYDLRLARDKLKKTLRNERKQ